MAIVFGYDGNDRCEWDEEHRPGLRGPMVDEYSGGELVVQSTYSRCPLDGPSKQRWDKFTARLIKSNSGKVEAYDEQTRQLTLKKAERWRARCVKASCHAHS